MRQGESAAWFDEWKKTRNLQPPQLPQLSASWINEAVKKAEPGFKPLDLPGDAVPRFRDSDVILPNDEMGEKEKKLMELYKLREENLLKEANELLRAVLDPSGSRKFKNSDIIPLNDEERKMLEVLNKRRFRDSDVILPNDEMGEKEKKLMELYKLREENLLKEVSKLLQGAGTSSPQLRTKKEEENLDKAFERVEEQRRREAELGERLDRLKSMRGGQWRVPALIELPESPFAISPWRWAAPKPIELLMPGRRREVPA
jgi:hypothetical protein